MTRYAKGQQMVNGIIVVNADKEFQDNPLFYIWSEYPKYKVMDGLYLRFMYEYYKDAQGNEYLVIDNTDKVSLTEIIKLTLDEDRIMYARNVDAFVKGADKDEYKQWLELIS